MGGPRRSVGTRRALKLAAAAALVVAVAFVPRASIAAETPSQQAPKPPSRPAPKKKAPPKPTTASLARLLEEQKALIEEQQKLIAEQQAKIHAQDGTIAEQQKELDAMQEQLAAMNKRLEELQQQLPASLQQQQELEERLRRVEKDAEKTPELPPDVVSAGEFPGSIRIPGTDAAVKFGGRIRTSAVLTLDPLGSSDRFVTNTIPVEPGDAKAGEGKRTAFSANTSRFNFEMRTPTGAGYLRTFIEGDFFGTNSSDSRVNFRLRHAFAQFFGFLVGQTWSTFSDPAADYEDLDFEGINGENVIRQPQIRYTWIVRDDLSASIAAETPEVSITGGQGVNLIPDLVGRTIWKFRKTGHLQAAVVLRQIRGQATVTPEITKVADGWGASLSGVVPFHYFHLIDRVIFQLNFGKGNARYINDLNSYGGQDAVFNPDTGELKALPAEGLYLVYEHQWKEWEKAQQMRLRSSFAWSLVDVHNLDFQPYYAYHRTNRFFVNVVFSPIPRIDVGLEYIGGTRENKDGNRGSAHQIQAVGIFRF